MKTNLLLKITFAFVALFIAPLQSAFCATFSDDFASGLDPTYWSVAQTTPGLFSVDDTQGDVRLAKVGTSPGGLQNVAVDLNLGALAGDIPGDFSTQLDFRDAVVGPNTDQVELHVHFQDGSFFFLVYQTGPNVHVYNGSLQGTITVTGGSGTFTISRSGSTLTGYYNGSPIYSETNTSALTGIEFVDQLQPGSDDNTSVTFDNFSFTGAGVGSCTPPPPGIVSWWPGDGNVNDIEDGNNGTLENGATFGPGEVGQAFSFDGVDDEVDVPHNANQNTGSQITIDAWVYQNSQGRFCPIANKRPTNNIGGYTFETFSPGGENGLEFEITIAGTQHILKTSNVLTTGAFQHVAATYDGATMRIYVDGIERANLAATGAIDAVTDPFVIGRNVVVGDDWNGRIDEVQIFNRALTQAEIQAIVNAGSAGQCKPSPPQLLNISTRLNVLTNDNVLIGGFIVTGTDPKEVIVRGLGPSLSSAGVAGALANPVLALHKPDGTVITNNNWKDTQKAAIEATGLAPTNDLESAIVATLAPGNYTAIVTGKNNGTGVGLIEAYDLNAMAASQLANISTRGFVDTGDNVMIGGFIIGGGTTGNTTQVLVRAIGPSLANAGITDALANPTLELHDANGNILKSNNNWKDTQQTAIQATGLAPSNDLEAAILDTLAPGNYTAVVRGNNAGTGVALVEVYNLQ